MELKNFMRCRLFIVVLTAIYFALACFNLQFQTGFTGDESTYVPAVWQIFQGGPVSNLEHPLLSKTLQGVFAAIFVFLNVDPVVGMRFASVLAGAGVLIATYALAMRVANPTAAWVAALLCFCNTLFLVHARMVTPEMIALFFLMVSLYFFVADKTESPPSALILSGAFFGLSLSAKWIGIWLVPWLLVRLLWNKEFKKTWRFFARVIVFYVVGNAAFFLNHGFTDMIWWQQYILTYHQTSTELSAYNGAAAWTWFAVPQHLYYSRLVPDPGFAMMILSTMNIIFLILVVPALWTAMADRENRPRRLLAEAAICLYAPWLFVARPTYFFYALTLLPLLAILESWFLMSLWNRGGLFKNAACGLLVLAALCFGLFYPAAVGVQISNSYERMLAKFNFYRRPVFSGMMCQDCNLYFGGAAEVTEDH